VFIDCNNYSITTSLSTSLSLASKLIKTQTRDRYKPVAAQSYLARIFKGSEAALIIYGSLKEVP